MAKETRASKKKKRKKANNKAPATSKAKKSGAGKARTPSIKTLTDEVAALSATLESVMPLHTAPPSAQPFTAMRKVGLAATDGSPAILNVWVEDELVLHQGKRRGESRPRPIGEVITLTVEAVGNSGQSVEVALTNTDRSPFADEVPASGHYEGGNRYTVT